jgi:signal transduction histidine kinase
VKHRLMPVIATATVVVAFAVALIVAGLTVAVVDLRDAGDDSARAEQKLARIARLERAVIDLETGQRGYLVSGDGRFLEPYLDARETLPGLLAGLERSAAGDPAEVREVRAIVTRVRSYESTWALRIVDLAGRDLTEARRLMSTGRGKERVDDLRARFQRYIIAEQRGASATRRRADEAGHRAVVFGIAGAVVSALFILGFGAFLLRFVVGPVRRLSRAVVRLGRGDLQTEVRESGAGEVGELARGFNAMSRSLQEHRDELEGQTAEVEAQRDDLERTFSELEDEKAWVETLFGFVERLVAEHELHGVAEVAVQQLVRQLRADAGVLRVIDDEGRLQRCAVIGATRESVPEYIDATSGVTGRAATEHRPIVLSQDEAGLEIEGMAGPAHPARVRHELHLPLHRGDELLGTVAIGRVADRSFRPEDIERARGLAEQAGIALAKAIEERRATRLAGVNAAVLDATAFGVAMYDQQGRITVVNRVMREMGEIMGISYDRDLGSRMDRLAELAVDREAAVAEFRCVVADPSHRASMELHVPASGHWFVARTDPVHDRDGRLMGRIVSFRDNTQEHEIQRMRDEFVATVTHELRTPLSSVVAAVDLLEDETEEPTPGQRHWTSMIRRNVDRLLRLVDDLLTVARAESGQFTLQPEDTDLETIARDAAASATAGAEAKGVRLEVQTEPAPLRADVTRIAQACDNLVANAVKFTPPGGVVRLRVKADSGRGNVVLEVADSGIGIPEADRAQLFERFYRAPAATQGAIPGTGLGLTITKAIVEAHGGRIRVADGIDGGTAFVVALPTGGPPAEHDRA